MDEPPIREEITFAELARRYRERGKEEAAKWAEQQTGTVVITGDYWAIDRRRG